MASPTTVHGQGSEGEAGPDANHKRDPLTESDGLDLVGILSSIEETAYAWDLVTGRVESESNAAAILGVTDMTKISTGADYHALIAPEYLNDRLEVFSRGVATDRVRCRLYRMPKPAISPSSSGSNPPSPAKARPRSA